MKVSDLSDVDRELLTNFDLIPGVDVRPAEDLHTGNRRVFLVSVPIEQDTRQPASGEPHLIERLLDGSERWQNRHAGVSD